MQPVQGVQPLVAPLLVGAQGQPLGHAHRGLLRFGQGAHRIAHGAVHLHRQGAFLQQAVQVAGAVGLQRHRVAAGRRGRLAFRLVGFRQAVGQGLPLLHVRQVKEGAVLEAEVPPSAAEGVHQPLDFRGRQAVFGKLHLQAAASHLQPPAQKRLSGRHPAEIHAAVYLAQLLQLLHSAGHKVENRVLPGEIHPALADKEACAAQGVQHLPLCRGVAQKQLFAAGKRFGGGGLVEGVNLPVAIAEGGFRHHVPALSVQVDPGHQGQLDQLAFQLRGDFHHARQLQEGNQFPNHPHRVPGRIFKDARAVQLLLPQHPHHAALVFLHPDHRAPRHRVGAGGGQRLQVAGKMRRDSDAPHGA